MINEPELAAYRRDGYSLAPGLFSAQEVAHLRDHYTRSQVITTDVEDVLARGHPREGFLDRGARTAVLEAIAVRGGDHHRPYGRYRHRQMNGRIG